MAISDKYKKGSILKFENDKIDTVIVIGETVKNNEQYLLVAPYKIINENNAVTDQSKIILLKVSEDDNISIETNKDTVDPVVREIISKSNSVL